MKKNDRLTIVKAFSRQYRRAGKKLKGFILSKVGEATGYSRKHLMVILVNVPETKKISRTRTSPYQPILKPLKELWAIANFACGKRLVPLLPIYLDCLKRQEGWRVTGTEENKLRSLSPATADRLLKHERQKITLKGRSRTKPGTLLKNQIPIRTFSDWNEKEPGYGEIDSVHHCGGDPAGDYLYSLDFTDVCTGWNECRAHLGKGETRTLEALRSIRGRLPFPLKGIDFDTGGEFVNWHLIRYCRRNRINYTRAREGRKNDQCFVEQQNFSVVRRFVGYVRLDTPAQLQDLNLLYDQLSDYQNFFQTVGRLKEKVWHGTRLTRRYDPPRTPYQRVLSHPNVEAETKRKLEARFLTLNPRKLIEEINRLGRKLSNLH